MAQLILTATQDCPLSVTVKDRKGNVAQIQSPVWESTDPATLTVTPDPADGMKALASAVGPTGTAMVNFTGDADLGDGVKPIIGTLDVVVSAGEATVVEIAAGTPVEQPQP